MATRYLRPSDASALLYQLSLNRDYLTPWEPERDEDYWISYDVQLAAITRAVAEHEAGRSVALAIVDDADDLIGRVNINSIIRGAFQSASLGYWVAAGHAGKGLTTAAVRDAIELAFTELELHRLQAEILPANVASEAILRKVGFVEYGRAPDYLKIAGRWQEHRLFQLVNAGYQQLH
jgi:ribosomal-protein-alanine N-acetyltransferase